MSTTVKPHIIASSALHENANGLECTDVYRVMGLSGDPSQRKWEAMLAVGVPRRLDPHPTIGGMRVDERSADVEQTSATSMRVNIIYRTVLFGGGPAKDPEVGDPPQIEIGSTLTTTQTSLTWDGKDLALVYTPTAQEVANGEMLQAEYPTVATTQIQIPQSFVRYKIKETTDPGAKSQKYVGKTNSTPIWGFGAGLWLCSAITGTSSDGGKTYVNTYEFQYAFNLGILGNNIGWNVTLRAEKDGKPMALDDVNARIKGLKEFQVLPREEFHNIGI